MSHHLNGKRRGLEERRYLDCTTQPSPDWLRDITPRVVKDFEKKCSREKHDGKRVLSKGGVTQYLIALQGMVSTAIKEGWFEGENPVTINYRHSLDQVAKFLSEEEVDRLLTEAKKLDTTTYLSIAVAVHTGMRKDEVTNLRWEDIDFERKVITLQAKQADPDRGIQEFQLKSRKARPVPLKESLAAILKPHRKQEGYVIVSRSGREVKRSRWKAPSYLEKVEKNTGIQCNPHLLRHTFASWAAIRGVSIYKISEWRGQHPEYRRRRNACK